MALPPFKNNERRYLSLVGSFLINLMSGTFHLWGLINQYLTSYFNYHNQNLRTEDAIIVNPIMLTASTVSTFFSLPLSIKIGVRRSILIFITIFSISTLITSFITNYYLFLTIYGLLLGTTNGFLYMIPYYIAQKNFPKNQGIASGITSAGVSMSNFVFGFVTQKLANPNNERFDQTKQQFESDDVAKNVPFMFQVLSGIFFGLGIIGFFLSSLPKEQEQQKIKENNDQENKENQNLIQNNSQINDECPNFKTAFKQPLTYLTIIMQLTYGSQGLLINNIFKNVGETFCKSMDDQFVTIVGSLASIFNGSGRILWGYAIDKTQFKVLALINLTIQFIIMITFQFSSQYKATFMIVVLIAQACLGGWFAKMPILLIRVYGRKIGPQLFPVALIGQVGACWLQYFVVQIFKNKDDLETGYKNIFYIFSGVIGLGIIITSLVKLKIQWSLVQ